MDLLAQIDDSFIGWLGVADRHNAIGKRGVCSRRDFRLTTVTSYGPRKRSQQPSSRRRCVAEDQLLLSDYGNPGMASGGMGDVLSGVIGALIAQGNSLDDAARVGVCLHSAAADKAAIKGERGLLASDLMTELRSLANPGS